MRRCPSGGACGLSPDVCGCIEPMRCSHPLKRRKRSERTATFLTWLVVAICTVAAVAFWYLGGP